MFLIPRICSHVDLGEEGRGKELFSDYFLLVSFLRILCLLPLLNFLNCFLVSWKKLTALVKTKNNCRRGYLKKEKVVLGSYPVLELARFLLLSLCYFFSFSTILFFNFPWLLYFEFILLSRMSPRHSQRLSFTEIFPVIPLCSTLFNTLQCLCKSPEYTLELKYISEEFICHECFLKGFKVVLQWESMQQYKQPLLKKIQVLFPSPQSNSFTEFCIDVLIKQWIHHPMCLYWTLKAFWRPWEYQLFTNTGDCFGNVFKTL